ncbi:MAG TPA: HAMP domain-containing sensor histidine kinase [Phycisphaerales bacterium]|nr:HAMP domain-containing sensor histidine kinase [Phycisphaerales bacterium]
MNPEREDSSQPPHRRTPLTGANNAAVGPLASYEEVEHLGGLIAKLDSLLDGSKTTLDTLKSKLSGESVLEIAMAGEVEKRLTTAAQALERMSELVHNAMQGPSLSIGSASLARSRPVTLAEAIDHAVELLTPMAKRRGVDFHLDLVPAVASLPAGALYTVVLNALQNAVESISRRGVRGRVDISVRHDRAPVIGGYGRDTRDWYLLEVTDDGAGLPANVDSARLFDLGFTTKPRASGVGLAVARNVVQGMGGTIELAPREGVRGGAILRVKFPSPAASGTLRLGGAA